MTRDTGQQATPTVTLAKQVRAEVFPKCDAILVECKQHILVILSREKVMAG
jgi:hypothetical protein